jgi:ankyrin repeat protein
MNDIDILIGLIRDRNNDQALKMLDANPSLATERSAEEGQMHGALALHWAAHGNAAQVCARLIELGADVNDSATHWWRTPLAWAADAGSAEAVHVLLARGAKADQDAALGTTALHAAAQGGSSGGQSDPEGYRYTAELLIEYGASVNRSAAGDRGQTPLDDALSRNNEQVALVLGKHGAVSACSKQR